MTPARTAALLLAASLLVGGCAPGQPTTSRSAAAESPTASITPNSTGTVGDTGTGSPDAGEDVAVPDTLRFSARTVAGAPFDGASLAGRPVLLWFWAPWCPTCRSQMPEVRSIAARHDGELAVVGVGSLDSDEAIAEFAEDAVGPVHLVDPDGAVWRHFGVTEQSSFVLLDADGAVALETGYGGSEELARQVAEVTG